MKKRPISMSISMKFRPSRKEGKAGTLFYQIIYGRRVRRMSTGCHVYPVEWDSGNNCFAVPDVASKRYELLLAMRADTAWEMRRFEALGQSFGAKGRSIAELMTAFRGATSDGAGFFAFVRHRCEELRALGRQRSYETMQSTLNSFMHFRSCLDIRIERIDRTLIAQYEAYMKTQGLSRNTSSFYLRNLRTVYNLAVADGKTPDNRPFGQVYTGVDRTLKRAVDISDIRRVKRLRIKKKSAVLARDIMLFSFYARGMSFIDMAFLRKSDVADGHLVYRRRKTGQRLSIEVVPEIRDIIRRNPSKTQYLLPIICREDGTELRQYRNQLSRVNRHLKRMGCMVGLPIPLTTYVMRHTWATAAHRKGIALSTISEALGHENERTTRIYLDSIQASEVDRANRELLAEL